MTSKGKAYDHTDDPEQEGDIASGHGTAQPADEPVSDAKAEAMKQRPGSNVDQDSRDDHGKAGKPKQG